MVTRSEADPRGQEFTSEHIDLEVSQSGKELFLVASVPHWCEAGETEDIRLRVDRATLVQVARQILVKLEPSLADLLFQKLDRIADSLESLSGPPEKTSSKPPDKE